MPINLLDHLLEKYKEYGKIIVGVDFDDTIFPLTDDEQVRRRCARVRDILDATRREIHLCLWTVTDKYSLKYKLEIMRLYGLTPDYVNESPFMMDGSPKPYFNILLDDNAGLDFAYDTLVEFHEQTKPVDTSE